jgi:hypothetical protein
VVEFPHWPFGETIKVPEGKGAEEVEETVLEGGTGVELEVELGTGVDDGVGVDVELGGGGASPQRPN